MAKALLGHLPSAGPRAQHEIAALRRRIAALESQVDDLQTALALAQARVDGADLDLALPVDLDDEIRTLDAEHAASTV
jgi:multidrug resistance efflux pump